MPKGLLSICGAAAVMLALAPAQAQQPAAKPGSSDAGLPVGPATVAPHWSKYDYPKSVPEGAPYYIIEKGDTLWDLSKRFLGSPYLWPQIWNENKYVTDAHWIYPGDPLMMPKVALISDQAGAAAADAGLPDEGGVPGSAAGAADAGTLLYPLTEELALQCSAYIVPEKEDDGLRIMGSEQGRDKVVMTERDIAYLNRGSNAGVKAGDVYSFQRVAYKVKHPHTGKTVGTKIEVTGWGRVILVTDNSASVEIERACDDITEGNYLKPFEKQNVPLALRRPQPDRLTPPSGKAEGYVVDIADNHVTAGDNSFVQIDMGSESGLAPGNLLTVYRVVYPSQPTPRNVVGEVAVLAVRERTATAKVMNSRDAIVRGDRIELR